MASPVYIDTSVHFLGITRLVNEKYTYICVMSLQHYYRKYCAQRNALVF